MKKRIYKQVIELGALGLQFQDRNQCLGNRQGY